MPIKEKLEQLKNAREQEQAFNEFAEKQRKKEIEQEEKEKERVFEEKRQFLFFHCLERFREFCQLNPTVERFFIADLSSGSVTAIQLTWNHVIHVNEYPSEVDFDSLMAEPTPKSYDRSISFNQIRIEISEDGSVVFFNGTKKKVVGESHRFRGTPGRVFYQDNAITIAENYRDLNWLEYFDELLAAVILNEELSRFNVHEKSGRTISKHLLRTNPEDLLPLFKDLNGGEILDHNLGN